MLGSIIGDIIGSRFEFNNIKTTEFELVTKESKFTDDTILTIAIMDLLNTKKEFDNITVATYLKKWGKKYPQASYGSSFMYWLHSPSMNPYYSYGNGAAMRISPLGLYSRNRNQLKKLNKIITGCTHDHPEGIKGAEVTATCVYLAKKGVSKEKIKAYAEKRYPEIKKMTYENLVRNYHFNETCQDSVPQALYCFFISNSFEDCMRKTISIGGDSDTLAAINGGLAEVYYKETNNLYKMRQCMSKIPVEMYKVINTFYSKYGGSL